MVDLQVPQFYEHAPLVLDKMRASGPPEKEFDAAEFTREYVDLYPEDRKEKEANGDMSLEGYLNGMLYEYERKVTDGRIVGPLIKRLGEKHYRFVAA